MTKPRDLLESLRVYRKPVAFEIPDGKGTLFLQALNMAERLEFADVMTESREQGAGKNAEAFAVAVFVARHGVVDERGEKVFGSIDETRTVLGDISETIVFDIAQRVLDLSGMSKSAEESAEKN